MNAKELKALRTAVADYMQSEGCSCCQNIEAHNAAEAVLAKLLKVGKLRGWRHFNFRVHATKQRRDIHERKI